jgi:hypothetical protein
MGLRIAAGWVEIGRCLLSMLAAGSAYWPYVKTFISASTGARTGTPPCDGGDAG